ncbi:uncharacterized protein LOC128558415 isoform X2 [Mercenaria mercenaria]|uniref:uncharacterized protein LOC128558415 isoform X2 n=1 Tax=Mercenaria mercenaria TaxID=6596 RepID=UPI00234E6BED|nr:uncharacterized protein LOC128558415 isoform X2 [Mercenaria mercenaria]
MTNKQRKMKPTVRDRGYAWVIVIAAFFLQAIQDGVRFSYGLYFVEFLNEFNKGKGQTAWVGSIMLSVFNLAGPISAYIVNRFGYRIGTMAGSLVTTVAFLLSYFAPNLYYLYFTFGALQGFGFGMVFLSGYVATGKYFKKRRALAVGITFCGGGIGTFVFLPVARLIIDTFGWRGSVFILAGVALHECVFASLLRPFIEEEVEINEPEIENMKNKKQSKRGKEHGGNSRQDVTEDKLDVTHSEQAITGDKLDSAHAEQAITGGKLNMTDEKVSVENTEEAQSIPLPVITTDIDTKTDSPVAKSNDEHPNCTPVSATKNENDRAVSTHDIDTSNSKSNEHNIETMTNKNDKTKIDKFKNAFIENVFPKELVTNSNFIILMLSTVFIAIPEFVPYSMLPDFALTVKSSSSQSAWMLSAVGIGATISQVGAGWLADMKCVHNLSLLGGCILSIGVTTMIVAVIPMFETLITYSVLFGLFSGAMYSVQPIVLLEYIDEKHMATMHGLTMWVYGISGLIGSPAAGPISAYIVNRFGYRTGTMAGSLITTVAFLLSYFAPNLYYLYFTFGALQGFGFGMVFLSGYVATVKYFKKRRALAVGITFCGGGIGTFVFLPVAQLIIDTFGWRGSMFILAGVTLHECVFASLLRPFIEEEVEINEPEIENLKNNKQSKTGNEHGENSRQDITEYQLDVKHSEQGITGDKLDSLHSEQAITGGKLAITDGKVSVENTEEAQSIPVPVITTVIDTKTGNPVARSDDKHPNCTPVSVATTENDRSASTHDIDTSNSESNKYNIESMTNKNDKTKNGRFKIAYIEKVFPKKLVTNSNFIILMLSTVFIAIPEFVPYSMLPDFALTVKCSSSQSAWMLSAVGIGGAISQICAGWLADMKCVHNLSLLGGCILSIGVMTMIVAVIPMFETLITYSVLYGLFSGAMYCVQPIVLLEYIDEKHMATIQGLTMWVYGISGLIGSPAAGWLFDATGKYTLSFLAAGACFAVSGCINFLVLVTRRSREARKLKKLKTEI